MNDGSGPAKRCLQVLHLEDDPLDAELIRDGLHRAWHRARSKRKLSTSVGSS